MNKKNNDGYVILIGVVITGAITLLIAIGAMTQTIGVAIMDSNRQLSMQEKLLTESCAELALMNMLGELQYIGNEDIILSVNTCHIGEVSKSSGQSVVYVQNTKEQYEWDIKLTTRNGVSGVLIDNWSDVTNN